MEHKCTKPGNS